MQRGACTTATMRAGALSARPLSARSATARPLRADSRGVRPAARGLTPPLRSKANKQGPLIVNKHSTDATLNLLLLFRAVVRALDRR